MIVNGLTYSPKVGGVSHGTLFLHLTIGNTNVNSVQYTYQDLLEEILAAYHTVKGIPNIVIDTTKVGESSDLEEILNLIILLKDNEMYVTVKATGDNLSAYLREAHMVIAVITKPKWLNFKAHEIHYIPETRMEIEEPILSEVNQKAGKYLFLMDKVQPVEVFSFLQKATCVWGIITPAKRTYEMPFIVPKGELSEED